MEPNYVREPFGAGSTVILVFALVGIAYLAAIFA